MVGRKNLNARSPGVVRCGVYEIDLEAGELHKNGLKVRLQEQPFKVLVELLSRPGQLVTRERLQEQLWGAHSLVDPELGLNTAIKKLRAAFGDSADNPRFIETIPRRGYRFLAPVRPLESMGDLAAAPKPLLRGAKTKLAESASAGDHLEVSDSGLPRNENALPPEMALKAGANDGRAEGAIRRSALFATLRGNGYKRACYGVAALILVLACAGVLSGQIPHISLGYSTPKMLVSVYKEGRTPDGRGSGIGGYDLRSRSDRAFAFDYDHSGKPDHVVLYRPGTGTIWFLKNSGGTFKPVYSGNGIGQYDLKSAADRVIAFDYDHSGKLDHLALYQPGNGIVAIFRNNGDGVFASVYEQSQNNPGMAIPDFTADQIFAFDYDHSGKLDHLVLYNPGTGILETLTNANGTIAAVCAPGAAAARICTYDLKRPASQALAFDYDHSGKLDHLVLYSPGAGLIAILENLQGNFVPVYEGSGIGGYDLKSTNDRAVAIDYDHSGRLDHLLLYRPGTGIASILKNTGGTFAPVYKGRGIGEYDLASADDRAFALDYDHTGKLDHLVLYRPGSGFVNIAYLR